MAFRRDEDGQVILLAGILLVISFIVFSIQVSILPQVGQQVGQETENPLFEDYLLIRRTIESLAQDEMRNTTNAQTFDCPDMRLYAERLQSGISILAAFETNRGQSFAWQSLEVRLVPATTRNMEVTIALRLSDGLTTVGETVTYPVACNAGTVAASGCPGSVCLLTP